MKKILLSLFVLIVTASSINAQSSMIASENTTEQKKPHELTKITLLKLVSDLSIDNSQAGKCYSIFENYFTARANVVDGLNTTEVAEKEAQGALNEIISKRDIQLETIFTTQQFTKWKQIAPAFMKVVLETK